ncbi:UvrB/UvrC motif-containing protein [Sphingomonas sp. 3P27F8]|uniref:UvrB/UvrC motif-containing protein n=1 Tax=Sphingomonas sp. 3P27F8 TaxID=2502213 RepID=UPI0032C3E856
MEDASRALDFEEAQRCRDRISLLRGGAAPDAVEQADIVGLARLRPGAMGLGTNQPRIASPKGWRPPPKPDPMTLGRNRRRPASRKGPTDK